MITPSGDQSATQARAFSLADPDHTAALLTGAGIDAAAAGWAAVTDALQAHQGPGGVRLPGAAWLATAPTPAP